MRFSIAAAAAAILSALSVRAQNSTATYNVLVGFNDSLVFNPTSLTGVNAGDTVNFQFVSKNHSVTQSSFLAPCTANGVSSGFQNVSDPTGNSFPTWSFTVTNNSAPLWFFCAQSTNTSTHCQAGMVFAINPTAAKNFTTFQAAAMATSQNGTTNPAPIEIISGSAGATDGAVSVTALTSEASISPGTATSGGSAATTTGSGSSPASTSGGSSSGALGLTGNTASLLAAVGLVAGLVL